MSFRHPYYSGRKAESVPSVGSRMPGVVKPSYGKPKIKIEGNEQWQTQFVFRLRDDLGFTETGAKSPRRMNRAERAAATERKQLIRHAKQTHKRNADLARRKPRLVS